MAIVRLHRDAKIGVLGIGDHACYAGEPEPSPEPFGPPVTIPDETLAKYIHGTSLQALLAAGHLDVGAPVEG